MVYGEKIEPEDAVKFAVIVQAHDETDCEINCRFVTTTSDNVSPPVQPLHNKTTLLAVSCVDPGQRNDLPVKWMAKMDRWNVYILLYTSCEQEVNELMTDRCRQKRMSMVIENGHNMS